eukprot:4385570-Prymnesium_polylepis.1
MRGGGPGGSGGVIMVVVSVGLVAAPSRSEEGMEPRLSVGAGQRVQHEQKPGRPIYVDLGRQLCRAVRASAPAA